MYADLEETAKEKKGSGFKLPNDVVNFCVYMLEKYGDDYQVRCLVILSSKGTVVLCEGNTYKRGQIMHGAKS